MSHPDTASRDEFFDSLLGDFLDESGQLLDKLNENLLQLDEWVRSLDEGQQTRCNDSLLNEMFRSAHSLKGLSAMLGLNDINGLTHKIENVFDAARKNQLVLDGEVVEIMFQAVDRLGGLVETLKDPAAGPVNCEPVIEGITSLLRAAGAERRQTTQADAERAMSAVTHVEQPAPAGRAEDLCTAAPCTPAPPAPSQTETRAANPQLQTTTPETPAAVEPDPFDGVADETEINGKYLSIFVDEAVLSLDSLTEILLALEGRPNREAIENLLLISHRIKGSAASVGLNRAAKLAHLMEDILQDLVSTNGGLSPEVTDAMLRCTDVLRQYVEALKQGGGKSVQFSQAAQTLLTARNATHANPSQAAEASTRVHQPLASHPAPPIEQSTPSGITEELRCEVAKVAPGSDGLLVGKAAFQPALPLVGLKARLIFEKLRVCSIITGKFY